MDLPDVVGREETSKAHQEGKPVFKDVDVATLTRQTHGFSDADLANLVNEAGILAARQNRAGIGFSELGEAVDGVIAGPARLSRKICDREREIVAYHEARHALTAAN